MTKFSAVGGPSWEIEHEETCEIVCCSQNPAVFANDGSPTGAPLRVVTDSSDW